jgi:hypothetical protein
MADRQQILKEAIEEANKRLELLYSEADFIRIFIESMELELSLLEKGTIKHQG